MNTKVVFVSGYAEFSYAQKALRMGVSDYLLKPVEEEELKEALEELMKELDGERESREEEFQGTEENFPFVIQNIIQEIQENFCGELTLKSLADKYYISDSRLSVQLKEQLDMSFPNYLASLRIQKAKELMRARGLSLETIAKMVGFKDYFYFNKVFKKMEGVSPSKFRSKL